jgi:hypothetical protein
MIKNNLVKHLHHLKKVVAALSLEAETVLRDENSIIRDRKNNLYILIEGEAIIRSVQNRRIITRLVAPAIFGLRILDLVYLQTTTMTVFKVIPFDRAMQLIGEQNLWENMFYVLHGYACEIHQWNEILSQPSAYDMVCNSLKLLESEPHAIKYTVTALSYVQERTGLSRSSIFSIFSKLRKEKKITMHRGVLVNINRECN